MALLTDPFDLPAGRLLGLDLGQARHGVAVCDEAGILATPVATLARARTRVADFAAVAALVAREKAVGVLVGLPHGPGEAPSAQARWVRRYAGRLAGFLSVPVAFWDETLSSHDARQLPSVASGRIGVDAAAAALILQGFLDARPPASRKNACALPGGSSEPSWRER
jgi:putative Holliday junction resolvase